MTNFENLRWWAAGISKMLSPYLGREYLISMKCDVLMHRRWRWEWSMREWVGWAWTMKVLTCAKVS